MNNHIESQNDARLNRFLDLISKTIQRVNLAGEVLVERSTEPLDREQVSITPVRPSVSSGLPLGGRFLWHGLKSPS